MAEKRHWYSLSYIGPTATGGQAYASAYIGYEDEGITMARIAEGKTAAGVMQTATLLAASYLGHMTSAQFKGEAAE